MKIEQLLKLPYEEYLKTDHWETVKFRVTERDDRKCTICESDYDLEVHHKKYENKGYTDLEVKDCITLCHLCHRDKHFHRDGSGLTHISEITN